MKEENARTSLRPYRMVARADAARATAERVLDVALELFTARPYEDVSVEEIAQHAEVTRRTVLRRFGSKEALFLAAMERGGREEMRARDEAPVGDVAAAVVNVVAHYERWGANRLRLLSQQDRIPVVAEDVQIGRRYHWSWVERTFAPLIDGLTGAARKRRIATLVVLTDVYTWKLLRRDLGLSQADTNRTLIELIDKLKGESSWLVS
ncbi:MAG: TetR/AcrR family transcriptional regulator [Actinomycetota bacterium]|nr:TetR/AcrR family transcriptional regulator [Actinomycetota bacterium]